MEDFIISIHKCISLGTSGTFGTSDLPEKSDRQKSTKIPKNIHNLPVTTDEVFSCKTSVLHQWSYTRFSFLFYTF